MRKKRGRRYWRNIGIATLVALVLGLLSSGRKTVAILAPEYLASLYPMKTAQVLFLVERGLIWGQHGVGSALVHPGQVHQPPHHVEDLAHRLLVCYTACLPGLNLARCKRAASTQELAFLR